MDLKYQKWIDANVSPHPSELRGRCAEVSAQMCKAFPELHISEGLHYWCIDSKSNIVDPTVHLFRREGYQQWIKTYVSPHPDAVRGQCQIIVEQMIETFPELRAASGKFGDEPHWWCVDPAGSIIDPTRHQFAFNGQYNETPQRHYIDTAERPLRVEIPA